MNTYFVGGGSREQRRRHDANERADRDFPSPSRINCIQRVAVDRRYTRIRFKFKTIQRERELQVSPTNLNLSLSSNATLMLQGHTKDI